MLPLLARVQDAHAAFQSRYQRTSTFLVVAAILFIAGYTLAGNHIIAALFGDTFTITPLILAWLGCALAIRIIRIGPGTATLAKGDSRTLMHANLWRVGGLLLAAWAGIAGLGLPSIAAAAALGELAALFAGILFLYRRHGVSTPLPMVLSSLGIISIVAAWPWIPPQFAVPSASGLVIMLLSAGLLYRAQQRAHGARQGVHQ